MICRDGWVGAASQTAPTKGYEPPLKSVSAVVTMLEARINSILTWSERHIDVK